MDVVGVESRSDLVDVTVNKPLGPRHDGFGLRAWLWSRRHGFCGGGLGDEGSGEERA